MKKCNFCYRTFRNSQAVRAHLKHCPVYRRTLAAQTRNPGSAQTAYRRPPPTRMVRPAPIRQVARYRPNEWDRQENIRMAVDYVFDRDWPEVPDEAKAQVRQAIEQELAKQPAHVKDDIETLIELARACRDKTLRDIKHLRDLLEFGEQYAREEIAQEGLTEVEARRLQRACRVALKQDLGPDSTNDDARAVVDEVLNEELGPIVDNDQEPDAGPDEDNDQGNPGADQNEEEPED